MDSVASRYASALFELANEASNVEGYELELDIVKDVFKDEEILSFFNHSGVEKETKKELLEKYFNESVSRNVLNFLKLLIDKHRIKEVVKICDAYHEMYLETKGIQEGVLYSPYSLSDVEVKKVEEALSLKTKKTIVLKTVIDPQLIGGIRVEINQEVYDGSVKNKINILKKDLLRK